jgi:hypothetical protein
VTDLATKDFGGAGAPVLLLHAMAFDRAAELAKLITTFVGARA